MEKMLAIEVQTPDAAIDTSKLFFERVNAELSELKAAYPELKVREMRETPDGALGEAELIRILMENLESIKDASAIVYHFSKTINVIYQTFFGKGDKKKPKDGQGDLVKESETIDNPRVRIFIDGEEFLIPLSDSEIEKLKSRVEN